MTQMCEDKTGILRALELQGDGIILLSQGGGVIYANKIVESLTGMVRQEIDERGFWRLVPDLDAETVGQELDLHGFAQRVTNSFGALEGGRYLLRFWALHESGSRVPGILVFVHDFGEAFLEEGGLELEGVFRTQSLEAIGRVCGKLGHVFNNILASIRGSAEMIDGKIRKLTGEPNPVERQLRLIDSAVNKGVMLTTKMRSFVRPGVLDVTRSTLKPCIDAVVDLLRRSGAASFEIEQVIEEDPPVEIHQFAVVQMLMGISLNAIEAMSEFNERLILYYLSRVEAEDVSGGELPAGSYARLSIIDHGVGIPAAQRGHITEPFFTTKSGQVGKGFGLSLAMASETMKKHRGFFAVASKEGCGTAVHLYFPTL